ncbi:MAG: sulfatase-like hydrolase/transferase, partial [Eubacterium sp.]
DLTGLEPVRLEEMENDYPGTEQYLSLMRNSDAAFGYLVEYFKTQEAPTLIVMFGDHQATIEQEFYEELMGGKPLEHWTLEELQRRYATPFVIWANYDIEEKNIDKLSINYLQSLLLEHTGLEQTAYNEYLMELSETLPVINTNGTIGANGEYYRRGEESPYSEQLLEYKRILYNGTFDVEQRRNDLFYIHTDQ